MRLINLSKLSEFCEKHPDSRSPIEKWIHLVRKCNWQNPNEIKDTLPKVSLLNNNRVVFNVKGNDYRLVVVVQFSLSSVIIRWIGKHSDYDKIDANTI